MYLALRAKYILSGTSKISGPFGLDFLGLFWTIDNIGIGCIAFR